MVDGSERARWRKSSYSADINCVEFLPGPNRTVMVRDSKDIGPTLRFAPAAWRAFTANPTFVERRPAG
ncbi:DUF397 domain-containing protein [Catenuloplanes atrovinosus]|uniref:DUF397 domain-containing protein n=1 Tax=Catenuloplanes atrovinosus TaxID=137266 RepID=UPI00286B4E49|nr:DUF397 domain-containing protein [Catenuloplanes atrovinosus]